MANLESALARSESHEVEETSWGKLVWMVSGGRQNSATMTVGRCYIEPGQANPRHYHPNCDEMLHVVQGRIEHSLDGQTMIMEAGDTISIAQGVMHNARNIGTETAVFVIAFSSPDRQTVGE